ncbi:FxDxF family PEP-CTERM protein [Roseateles sp. BYS87W]|uniref:FxDxF family PEP-CTERM protein n=1 Tax=Pelomonas baiyunensis TaxID=3299026 RepID=A0ABW7GXF0_9BURK
MQLKTIFTAAALAASAAASQAAAVNWGNHDQLESAVSLSSGGVVFDTYAFTLNASSNVASSVSSLGVAAGNYTLWTRGTDNLVGTADDVSVATWSFTGNPVVHNVALGAGSYYYAVFGYVTGAGAYSLNSSAVAAPVPEPETYALFAAGLGMVGFIASRRRRD